MEGWIRTFINSDVLITAFVEKNPGAVARIKEVESKLNLMSKEKLGISDFVYNDLIRAGINAGMHIEQIRTCLFPGHTMYYQVQVIPEHIVEDAVTAMHENSNFSLSLTDWTSLLWMACEDVRTILSYNKDIDRLIASPKKSQLPDVRDILCNIRRI